jgi:hypothetical protein
MILKQAAAENLELASGNFLVGGFEQGAQRDQPAEIFIDPVLQHHQFGRGDALEFGHGDALFPPSDRVGRDQRQQQSGACRNQCRQVKPWPRRGVWQPQGCVGQDVARLVLFAHRRLSFDCPHSRSEDPGPECVIGHGLKISSRELGRMPSSLYAAINDLRVR